MTEYNPPAPRSDLRWIGVDLDGTLAEPLWTPDNPTSEIGAPIVENVLKLKSAVEKGFKAVIHTSRPWTEYEAVEHWLLHHNIPFKEIQMGKPLYLTYVDDRAVHESSPDWSNTQYTYNSGYQAALGEVLDWMDAFSPEQVRRIVQGLL